jgi:hypothetical protein
MSGAKNHKCRGLFSVGNIFRIYTEEKNKRDIVRLAGQEFDSFTLQPTLGYYQGKSEKSIVIEIVGARAPPGRGRARTRRPGARATYHGDERAEIRFNHENSW